MNFADLHRAGDPLILPNAWGRGLDGGAAGGGLPGDRHHKPGPGRSPQPPVPSSWSSSSAAASGAMSARVSSDSFRTARSARPDRVFEDVREVVRSTGVLKGRQRRALDSTVLDDAVATQDTITQLIAAVRSVIRHVPGAAEVASAACTAHDYTEPGKPRIAWNDEQARAGTLQQSFRLSDQRGVRVSHRSGRFDGRERGSEGIGCVAA